MAALCRSAQPDDNFSARCIEDERLLLHIARSSASRSLLVVDIWTADDGQPSGLTPTDLAEANVTVETAGLPGLAELRASLEALCSGTQRGDLSFSDYVTAVARSGWLTSVHALLTLAARTAERLEHGESVLVQCASGVDHTAQVCSLAQLLLDPSARTLEGFQRLIEKDWLQFSHPFPLRCQHLPGLAPDHTGPVFLLFLDAAWQLWRQCPPAFEFNEHLLATLHDHSQGSAFGTFACNCLRQRNKLRLSSRSFSLWGLIAHHRSLFSNSLFRPESFPGPLRLSLSAKRLRLWSKLFHRGEASFHPRSCPADLASAAIDESAMWSAQAVLLRERILQLAMLLKIPEEKIRKQLATANSSKVSFLSNGSFDVAPSHNGGSWRPSGSSVESGLGGSVDSPTWGEPVREAREAVRGPLRPPVTSAAQLRREINTVRVPWDGLQAAEVCAGCGLELDNCAPKRNCFLCGRVLCRRCLRAPAGRPPPELRLLGDNAWRFRLCLHCEAAS